MEARKKEREYRKALRELLTVDSFFPLTPYPFPPFPHLSSRLPANVSDEYEAETNDPCRCAF